MVYGFEFTSSSAELDLSSYLWSQVLTGNINCRLHSSVVSIYDDVSIKSSDRRFDRIRTTDSHESEVDVLRRTTSRRIAEKDGDRQRERERERDAN